MDAGKSSRGDLTPVTPGYVFSGKIMLTAVVVIFAGFLLLLFFHLCLRWRTLHRSSSLTSTRRRRPRRHLSFAAAYAAPHASADDRHGLDPAVLKSLPAVVFSASEEDDEATCAVCISEFEQREEVRCLPQCGHWFHVECIDMWFRSHATCPLCRSSVEAPAPVVQINISADPSPAFLTPDLNPREECAETSSSAPDETELRIEVPERERAAEGSGTASGSKSPGTTMRLLRRILSADLMLCRGVDGGERPEETDLEHGDYRSPPPRHPAMPPATATVL